MNGNATKCNTNAMTRILCAETEGSIWSENVVFYFVVRLVLYGARPTINEVYKNIELQKAGTRTYVPLRSFIGENADEFIVTAWPKKRKKEPMNNQYLQPNFT